MARRAFDYLNNHFWDRSKGGAFWLLDSRGNPIDDKKKIYGQAFYIYALSEYYQAFEDSSALERAMEMFGLIEKNSHDQVYGGYIEVCNRDWSVAEDLRLSDKDMNEQKSMNNHLHLLEAYTNLYRIRQDALLRERLIEIIDIFDKRIIETATGHMNHFFDQQWRPKSDNYTFGHDIEGGWLLCEAAEVLDDASITSLARRLAERLARVTLDEGLEEDGGLCYEGRGGKVTDPNRQWWPQAESVVGFLNAFELTGDKAFHEAARKAWEFIEKNFIDCDNGEWFWRISPDGRHDPAEPKVSQWKGPYHCVRACLEVLRRIEKIEQAN
jgi:mannobiose 2-epimerase